MTRKIMIYGTELDYKQFTYSLFMEDTEGAKQPSPMENDYALCFSASILLVPLDPGDCVCTLFQSFLQI